MKWSITARKEALAIQLRNCILPLPANAITKGYDMQNEEYSLIDELSNHPTAKYGFHPMPKENILEEANRLVTGEKAKDYGSVQVACDRIAQMWSVILDKTVHPNQVALCMIALKIVREMNGHKRDSLVDIAGYAWVAQQLYEGEK